MTISVNWKFQAAVQGGPNLAADQPPINVAAYDVIQATIPATTPTFTVHVQPITATGQLLFFALTSDKYDAGLTYTVNASATVHTLDGPLLLIGGGAVGLLDAAPPQTLTLGNTLAAPANIQILVGRKDP